MNDSSAVALAVLGALRRAGVSDVVLAPGSRSAALAVAFQQADALGLVRLHVRIDERTAGFLALGLAKGSHRPVAVVTTSGTAVANLHPAVLEATHAGECLLVVSADRPAGLRRTGANQTTEQSGIFGQRVPCTDVAPGEAVTAADAIAAALHSRGPSQLNLQFDDPLLPGDLAALASELREGATQLREGGTHSPEESTSMRGTGGAGGTGSNQPDGSVRLGQGPNTVVVAGDDAGPPARLLAQEANWPLLAEPSSGARTGTHALRTYRLLLAGVLGQQIERVVVTGHPTLSRPVTRLISRSDIEVISVRGPGGVCTDPGRVARHVNVMPSVKAACADEWVDAWRAADLRMSRAVDELAGGAGGLPLQVAAEIAAAVTPQALLTVGSSQPIRDLDVMATPYPAGERRLIIANRGLAGIDGTVSTAIGAGLGRNQSSRALAYVGDLTFLHDANGLVIGPDEPRPNLAIVVVNDDGGAIFSTLEPGDPRYGASFERVFGTPHGVSIKGWCDATRTAYERVDDAVALRAALAQDSAGIRVVEVSLARSQRRSLDERLRSLTL